MCTCNCTCPCNCTPNRAQAHNVNLSFQAVRENGCPVSGAVFRISSTDGKYCNAVSGSNGCVNLCGKMPAGSYVLEMLSPAYGSLADDTVHTLEVTAGGCVRVDGASICNFRWVVASEATPLPVSDPPVIGAVYSGAVTIGGTGTPGCCVVITWPAAASGCVPGACAAECPVLRDGSWSIDCPCCVTLAAGDVIEAVQECCGKIASAPATIMVRDP